MAIIGNNTQLSVNGSGHMVVNTGAGAGTDRLTYDFTNGTLSEPAHVYAMIGGGFGGDTTTVGSPAVDIGQNYLDPSTVNNSQGTFTYTGGRMTTPRTGAYRMTSTTLCRTNWHNWASKNDSQMLTGAHNTGPAGYSSISFSWITYATAGDTLSFRGNRNSGAIWGGGWSMYSIDYIG
jgi:hypothetical protein